MVIITAKTTSINEPNTDNILCSDLYAAIVHNPVKISYKRSLLF